MYFVNVGIPPDMLKGLVSIVDKCTTTEPLVLVDCATHSYIIPVTGFGLPLQGVLYDIIDFEKFNKKIVERFNVDLLNISAKTSEGTKVVAAVIAARPFKNIDLSLQYGFKTKSKHIKETK